MLEAVLDSFNNKRSFGGYQVFVSNERAVVQARTSFVIVTPESVTKFKTLSREQIKTDSYSPRQMIVAMRGPFQHLYKEDPDFSGIYDLCVSKIGAEGFVMGFDFEGKFWLHGPCEERNLSEDISLEKSSSSSVKILFLNDQFIL